MRILAGQKSGALLLQPFLHLLRVHGSNHKHFCCIVIKAPAVRRNFTQSGQDTRQYSKVAALCERYGVAHLELFGSATGPNFNPESSDFDFLVDLVNPRYIRNPYFLQAVNPSRTVIYDLLLNPVTAHTGTNSRCA